MERPRRHVGAASRRRRKGRLGLITRKGEFVRPSPRRGMSHRWHANTFRRLSELAPTRLTPAEMRPCVRRGRGRLAMLRNGGTRGQTRSSALWGTGNNDDSRSNALWGKGGRGLVTLIMAALVLGIPLAASAGDNGGGHGSDPTWVAPGMLAQAEQHPNGKINVIVTADEPELLGKVKGFGHLDRKLKLIDGVALEMPASKLKLRASVPGLTITPDAPTHTTGSFSSKQLWVPNTGIDKLWNAPLSAGSTKTQSDLTAPTIAVVDSGVDTSKAADFGARVVQQVNLTSLPNNSAGDGRGHGTFVAGIAAGQAGGYAGASPRSNIVRSEERRVGKDGHAAAAR